MIKVGATVVAEFTTSNPTSGAAADADELPVGVVTRNGTNTAVVVTVTNKATGEYKASFMLASEDGFVEGDTVALVVSATIDSVVAKAVVWQESLVGNLMSEVSKPGTAQTITPPDDMALESSLDQVEENILTNLDYVMGGLSTLDSKVTDARAEGAAALRGGLVTAGTARAGSFTNIQLAVDAPSTNLINHIVVLTGGAGVGQARLIASYDTENKVATVSTEALLSDFIVEPDETTTYEVFSGGYQLGIARADTALSNEVWTNEKAAFIDATISEVSDKVMALNNLSANEAMEALWNATLEYVDETGATKNTKAWIMLQAMFSTIKQRLKEME